MDEVRVRLTAPWCILPRDVRTLTVCQLVGFHESTKGKLLAGEQKATETSKVLRGWTLVGKREVKTWAIHSGSEKGRNRGRTRFCNRPALPSPCAPPSKSRHFWSENGVVVWTESLSGSVCPSSDGHITFPWVWVSLKAPFVLFTGLSERAIWWSIKRCGFYLG